MKKVTINNTDLSIAPINFGGNVFGWTLEEAASFALLDEFKESGFNFIDTADVYSYWINGHGGQSETIIGKWLSSQQRSDIVIATKVGSETKEHGVDISKKHILKSAEDSLKRLGTDYIDIYYTHYDDEITPVEETLSAYDELIKAGKIRYIAASNISPARLQESFAAAEQNNLPKYIALQPHYNLLEREKFETQYADIVRANNLAVFPYWSLAAGFLTGKYREEADFEKSPRGGSVKKYFNEQGLQVLSALDKVAAKHQRSVATVSLAWLLANPLVTAPVVSATSSRQLKTLVDAPLLRLDEADINFLNLSSQPS
ncbi:aldo/keto reductase [Sphingobacteriaceae bacterium WQ 2009]|uniref:Aldo/keto reductase n=1 Tax=Rhinopithecimicrobium faecis TaxID=2820698 RepID=A0A8T4HDE7_9SPHI|nr:aldo/keto reductase [Sphingobacteriaceae bacterium WQ 2009]